MIHLSITDTGVDLTPGSEVVLRHQSWSDYERLLQCRQDNAAIRLRYSANSQEIRLMAPLSGHGHQSDMLADLVKALLRHSGQDWQGFDPITLKRIGQAGLEPDKCFYIRNCQAILAKEQIDLETDPPPDLAIEVDSSSLTSPEDYLPLQVPELWIYREQGLSINLFETDRYREMEESPTFPGIPVRDLLPKYVRRGWQAGSSVALREFERVLGEIAPEQ